jgi:PAS domain S-box-containing protein
MKSQHRLKVVSTFFFIQLALAIGFYYEVTLSTDHHVGSITSRLEDELQAAKTFHQDFIKNTLTFIVRSSCIKDVLSEMKEGKLSIAKARQRLYSEISPYYDLIKEKHISLLHFHLPDGTSFLRVHKPELFGENLFQIRPELKRIPSSKSPLFGFSGGKHKHAYRFILPIILSGEFIGSIEAGSSFNQYRASMTRSLAGEYFQILKKEAIETESREGRNNALTSLSFNSRFVYDQMDLPSKENFEHAGHINEKKILELLEKHQDEINDRLSSDQMFNVHSHFSSENFILAFFPEKSFSGEVIAYTIAVVKDSYIPSLVKTYIWIYIILTIILVVSFWIYSYFRTRLINNHRFQQILLDSIPIPVFVRNTKGEYIKCNQAYKQSVGIDFETIRGKTANEVFSEPTALEMIEQDRLSYNQPNQKLSFETEVKKPGEDKTSYYIVHKRSFDDAKGNRSGIIAAAMDVTPLKEQEKKQAELIEQLQQALEEVKTLQGILPVCSHCRKVRDDKGYWQQIEEYLDTHSKIQMSHGICADCLQTHYPEFADNVLDKNDPSKKNNEQ